MQTTVGAQIYRISMSAQSPRRHKQYQTRKAAKLHARVGGPAGVGIRSEYKRKKIVAGIPPAGGGELWRLPTFALTFDPALHGGERCSPRRSAGADGT